MIDDRMYAVRRWDEEKIIQGLAIAMVLAMVGMAITPIALAGSSNLAYIAYEVYENGWDWLYENWWESAIIEGLVIAGGLDATPVGWIITAAD